MLLLNRLRPRESERILSEIRLFPVNQTTVHLQYHLFDLSLSLFFFIYQDSQSLSHQHFVLLVPQPLLCFRQIMDIPIPFQV